MVIDFSHYLRSSWLIGEMGVVEVARRKRSKVAIRISVTSQKGGDAAKSLIV
jgi:hypothetical protein